MVNQSGNKLVAVQFLVAILPTALLLVAQSVADSRRAVQTEQSRPLRVYSQDARIAYKTFLTGVSDAVDTGSLSAAAVDSLKVSADKLQHLAAAGADPTVLLNAVPAVNKLAEHLTKGAELSALMQARDAVRAADTLTQKIAEEFDKRDALVLQEAIDSARQQHSRMQMALLLTLAITAVFLIASQRRIQARRAADRRIVEDSLRLQLALDSVSGIVMLADASGTLVYVNAPGAAAFTAAAPAIVLVAPDFNPRNMLGLDIRALHSKASPPLGPFADYSQPVRSTVQLATQTFHVAVSPVLDGNRRLGTIVEWLDVTQEVGVEHEVADIVAAAALGDLSKRLQLGDRTGSWAQLATGINGILTSLATVVKDVNRVVAAGKAGDLTPRIDLDGKRGAFADLSSGINSLMEKLCIDRNQESAVESEVFAMVQAAQRGDLSMRLKTAGKSGMWLQLASGINGIVDNLAAIVHDVHQVVSAGITGDLTPRIDITGRSGAFADLSADINSMMEDLMLLVREIKQISDTVRHGADEVSSGNLNLSRRTESRASSLEETASAMEQMTSTVRQSAGNAALANTLATAAREHASAGALVVTAAVTAMREINDSSQRIEAIIGVIDEIAFQTNLLALTAAVAAARAGEQGRGFAVVATEVRNLAGRSATAAKEIKTLIHESVRRVEEGSKLVDQTGERLGDIGSAVAKVTHVMAEIAASSQEQASGIEQVTKAVNLMDQSTQQNAALAEEAAAAGASIAQQAHQLAALVAHFQVEDGSPQRKGAGVRAQALSSSARTKVA